MWLLWCCVFVGEIATKTRCVPPHKQMLQSFASNARIRGRHALLYGHPFRSFGGTLPISPLLRTSPQKGQKDTQFRAVHNVVSSRPDRISPLETCQVAEETIYALSTAAGSAGIAIVRISGPACLDVSYRGCLY